MSRGHVPENILQVTEDELLRTDPGSLRIDRIAQAAGVNKRMIYHYFGDRAGLIQAVYHRQFQRLSHPQAALSDAARSVLQVMLRDIADVAQLALSDAKESLPGADDLARAARLMLPYLFTHQHDSWTAGRAQLSAADWVKFCVELMSLAFAGSAPVALPAAPGTTEFVRLSERLLTAQKPTIRLPSASRMHEAGARS